MALWVILLLGAFILAWCAIYGFVHVKFLDYREPPVAAGIALILFFVGWGIVTVLTVPNINELWLWAAVTGVYCMCFIATFCNAKIWLRAVDQFLPFD